MKRLAITFVVILALCATSFALISYAEHKIPAQPVKMAQIAPKQVTPPTVNELFALTNAERAKAALKPYILDPLLNKSAQMKADEMARTHVYSHINPETGLHGYEYIKTVGDSCRTDAENIAGDFSSQATIKDWLDSPAHREALLSQSYDKVGFGVHINIDGVYFVVAHFCQQ